MNKDSIIKYVQHTPCNTNPNVLSTLLDSILQHEGGADPRVKQMVEGTLTEFSDDTLTKINSYAFYNFSDLKTINIPNVEEIGQYAFQNCTAIESLSLPKLVTTTYIIDSPDGEIETECSYAFSDCTSLVSVSAPLLEDVAFYMFSGCTSLVDVYICRM